MRWRQKTGERAGPPAGPDLPGPRRAPDEPRAGVSAVAAGWLAGATQAGPQAGGRKEGLAIDVDGRIRSPRVIEVLSRLVSARGAPAFLRSDNGPGRCGMWGLRVPPRCITAPPGATAARSRPLKLTVVRRNRAGQDRQGRVSLACLTTAACPFHWRVGSHIDPFEASLVFAGAATRMAR